jgi:hypothetical protein
MSRHTFSIIQKASLYEVYGKKCFYCGELVYFRELHIDHIIPEYLLADKKKLSEAIKNYGLPQTFEINSYENWVPCHGRCNLRKGGELFDKTTVLYYLQLIQRKIPQLIEREINIIKKLDREKLLIALTISVETQELSLEELLSYQNAGRLPDSLRFKIQDEIEFIDRVYRHWLSQKDFIECLNLEVKTGDPHNPGLTLTAPEDEGTIIVRTCKEYFEAMSKGYYARTTYDMKMQGFFIKTCGVVNFLKVAQPYLYSHITEASVSIKNTELLKLTLLPSFSPDFRETVSNTKDITIKDWIDKGLIKLFDTPENILSIEYDGMGAYVTELMRADLNNDGTEDLLLFVYNYAVKGTLGYGYLSVISRRSDEDLFEEIQVAEELTTE